MFQDLFDAFLIFIGKGGILLVILQIFLSVAQTWLWGLVLPFILLNEIIFKFMGEEHLFVPHMWTNEYSMMAIIIFYSIYIACRLCRKRINSLSHSGSRKE